MLRRYFQRKVFMKFHWIVILCLIVAGCADDPEYGNRQRAGKGDNGSVHDTYIYGQKQFAAESAGALRVMVKKAKSLSESAPTAGAKVEVVLREEGKEHLLYQGKTSDDGNSDVRFHVPDLPEGSYTLEVRTASDWGEETVEETVEIVDKHKILLVTDKPIYQPGQKIHIRTLSLNQLSLKPVGREQVLIEVEDSKGNKVFKQRVKTGEYGIAYALFALADEVNTGNYVVRAQMGKNKTEKTVTVKKYTLPKFKVAIETDKRYFQPGEMVKGKVLADYFFGKPVSGGKVKLTASTFDVEFKEFSVVQGTTGEDGSFEFEVELPQYFVGQPLERGDALLKLDAEVLDKAEHTEKKTSTYPVARYPIRIAVVPESGKLAPGVANQVYVITTYPDGRPAQTRIVAKTQGKTPETLKARTDSSGIAILTLCPPAAEIVKIPPVAPVLHKIEPMPEMVELEDRNGELLSPAVQDAVFQFAITVEARDDSGVTSAKNIALNAIAARDIVLLRPDKAIYQAGDTIEMEVISTFLTGTVYVDFIKDRQTVSTSMVDLAGGRGRFTVEATSDLFGTLECHAYKLLDDGNFVRDTRIVYVHPPTAIEISVKPGKPVYLPGEEAVLSFLTTDKSGKPLVAALGVTIVDEAVYALQEMQPGLEKVYFTLEKELSEPKYQIKEGPGQSIEELVMVPQYDEAQQRAASVLLANVDSLTDYTWQRNPAVLRKQKLQANLESILTTVVSYLRTDSIRSWTRDGEWRRDLLRHLVAQGHLSAEVLVNPFGDNFTMEDLAQVDPAFTCKALSAVETGNKIMGAYHALLNLHYQENKDVQTIALDDLVAKKFLSEDGTVDGWGNKLRISTRPDNQNYYYWELRGIVVTSAGPDGIFDNQDDLTAFSHRQVVQYLADQGISSPLLQKLETLIMDADELTVQTKGGDRWADMAMPEGAVARPMMAMRAAPAEMAEMAKMEQDAPQPTTTPGTSTSSAPPPRIREYFPETLLFEPRLITDENGRADLKLEMADSITTWRLTANATSKDGLLGGTTAPIRVFQDFFVDIDFPVSLTQNDEVAVPVAIFNYLAEPQEVKLVATPEDWFDLLDKAEKSVTMQAKDVGVAYFKIKAKKIGSRRFTVMAYGSKMSDAIRRAVEIVPDGKRMETAVNGYLAKTLAHETQIPTKSVPEASKIIVKCYPGVGAVLVEGLGGMLHMPNG